MASSDFLRKTFPAWEHLSSQQQQMLEASCAEQAFEKGAIIHRSDMPCRGMIILRSGMLRAYVLSDEGREITLFRIRSGECCVMSASCLLDAIEFDIMIEASERAEACLIPAHVLHPMMEENPYVGLFIYKQATERFSDVMWVLQQLLFMGADRRVAIFLWDEMVRQSETTLLFTHEEVARNISSAREVVTKTLKYFSEEGIVSLSRGKIEILNKEKLKSLC